MREGEGEGEGEGEIGGNCNVSLHGTHTHTHTPTHTHFGELLRLVVCITWQCVVSLNAWQVLQEYCA